MSERGMGSEIPASLTLLKATPTTTAAAAATLRHRHRHNNTAATAVATTSAAPPAADAADDAADDAAATPAGVVSSCRYIHSGRKCKPATARDPIGCQNPGPYPSLMVARL